jgi:triosephosphate isomerase
MRQLIAGNWKMHGLGAGVDEIRAVRAGLESKPSRAEVMICPPATLLTRAISAAGSGLAIGAQDCHPEPSGAFTGDISAEMLKDAGARAVIVGHSERRQFHAETDTLVAAKARAAWRAGLTAIICIGETEDQRAAGAALDVVAAQLKSSVPDGASASSTVLAYEPVWAIGSGRTPGPNEIVQMHGHIRAEMARRFGAVAAALRILYGGSVKPGNAKEILTLPDVDGALIGGASLKAVDFLAIIQASRDEP